MLSDPFSKRCFSLCLLLVVLSIAGGVARASAGVPDRIEGRVVDEEGVALPYVMVVAVDADKAPLANCVTKSDGIFAAMIPEEIRASVSALSFKLLGFKTMTIAIDEWTNGRIVVMEEAPIELREVQVQAHPIRQDGDTLTYIAGGFRQKQDRSIADVIAKMPGLEVLPSGMIKYQGKSINKFYIEGMDLLGGGYAQASENLDARKVKSVQVLTNHQPIRVLKGISFSDQAALNIVLEDDAKNVLQGVFDLGAGTTLKEDPHFLRDVRAMGMLFSHKMQDLSLLKTNNTGKDIKFELMDLVVGRQSLSGPSPLLSPMSISIVGPDRSRYRHNDSHLAAVNHLIRTARGNDLRIRLQGFYDKSRVEQQRETAYLLEGEEQPTVVEALEVTNREAEAKAEVKYEVNREEFFLNSTLTGFVSSAGSSGQTVVNGQAVTPEMEARRQWLGHSLELISSSDGHRWSLTSRLLLSRMPGRLLLMDGSAERLRMDATDWRLTGAFSHSIGRFTIDYLAGLTLTNERLRVEQGSTQADRYRSIELYVDPTARMQWRDLSVTGRLHAALLRQSLGEAAGRFTPILAPNLNLRWEPSPILDLSLSAGSSVSPRDFRSITAIPYYTDYLTLREGIGAVGLRQMGTASAMAKLSLPMQSFFATLGLTCLGSRGEMLYERRLEEGAIYRLRATDKTGRSEQLMVNGRMSKGFGWGLLTVALSGDYSWQRYQMLVGERVEPFRSEGGNVGLSLYYHPMTTLAVELESTLTHSRLLPSVETLPASSITHSYHTLSLSYTPGNWVLKWSNELFYSPEKAIGSSYFADLSIDYRADRWEAGIDCRNLFGVTDYGEEQFASDAIHRTATLLRPRELLLRFSFSL